MLGKTALVTGANTGIGLETAAGLAAQGANVVITARDPAKGKDAVETIRRRHPDATVDVMQLDLSRLHDVRTFAKEFAARYPKLDVLINNAGLVLDKHILTEDGLETTFQVNHLGPFLLTNLLLDNLKAAAPSRIVNVASTAHRGVTIDFDDLQNESGYRSMRAYGKSKLCNILFTRELARRLSGTGVTANSLHPGTVRTGFGRDGDVSGLFAIGIRFGGMFFKSPAQGARTSIHVASAPDLENTTGEYFVNRRVSKPSAAACDDEAARRLWEVSEQLVGL
jgi:NAD(P)-dependent dehydrogenase (short-subunit alcohol dehydrogenase family)